MKKAASKAPTKSTTKKKKKRVKKKASQAQSTQPVKKKSANGKAKRTTIFGHSVTAVLRRLGLEGWEKEEAQDAIEAISGFRPAYVTVQTQFTAALRGERGEPASLSKKELQALRNAK